MSLVPTGSSPGVPQLRLSGAADSQTKCNTEPAYALATLRRQGYSVRGIAVEDRSQVGHWEIDTVLGTGKPCIVTLRERATGYVLIGKMRARAVTELKRATLTLL